MEPSYDFRVYDYAHDNEYENNSGSNLAQVSPLYESPKAMVPLTWLKFCFERSSKQHFSKKTVVWHTEGTV